MKTKIVKIAAALLLILCISTGAAAAAGNETAENQTAVNATNSSYYSEDDYYMFDELLENVTPLYINTEGYAELYSQWYDYYQSINPSEAEQREQIAAFLSDESADNETRFNNVLSYIGRSDVLVTFTDESKRTIDEYTGEVTYDLGLGNWWANLFGGGVVESELPHNVAQGNALYDVYMERYALYLDVEWRLVYGESV